MNPCRPLDNGGAKLDFLAYGTHFAGNNVYLGFYLRSAFLIVPTSTLPLFVL